MSASSIQSNQEVLGYTLKERIGSGGYGEVWSATAPGGLTKAIKFVYGYHDEQRALNELKALDRIKEVRHPFLLSLERIDVHNGQLVVVCELAENCLADVFNDYIAKGEPGIPRDKLLSYVRDAGDALDYLSTEHQLQHLDIKPENLLMVSGHVKVADFGLVKELGDGSVSLMAGMTPAYAAPELFDGRPCTASDQYSLAIVYQEMLTAIRPFPGTTPAQLAAQHMHGRPNLRPLPQGDQAVIARALSKDPKVRFESCRAMVEELLNKKRRKKTISRGKSRMPVNTDSMPGGDPRDRDVTAVISQSAMPFQAIDITTLDPPENYDPQTAVFQPTIVISVGNSANKVAQKIKQRLIARHGAMEEVPSFGLLCFDTDQSDLAELTTSGGRDSISGAESVGLPLRKPENYRECMSSHLKWLSRRWIYNVPRSLQTEGLRPLGRLAFADHFDRICSSIETVIKEVVCPENIATTCETVGMNPSENIQPRIVIMSSISGGVGSGMSLDLAYTSKMLLAENGLSHDDVSGIFFHSSNSRSRDAGLAAANAFSFFTELRHFTDNGFPGDSTLGMPESDDPPVDHCYFLDLGNDLPGTEFESRQHDLAEYVYLNTLSTCSEFFTACRRLNEEQEHFSLRTFGLSIAGPGIQVTGNQLKNQLVREMLDRWINGRAITPEAQMELVKTSSEKWLKDVYLDKEGISKQVSTIMGSVISESKWNEVLASARSLFGQDTIELSKVQNYFDLALGPIHHRKDSSHVSSEFCAKLDHAISNQATQTGDLLATDIQESINQQKLDLSIPLSAVELCSDQLHLVRDEYDDQLTKLNQRILNLEAELVSFVSKSKKTDGSSFFEKWQTQYANERHAELACRYAKEFCRVARNCLRSPQKLLQDLVFQLRTVSRQFEDADEINDRLAFDDEIDMDELMARYLEKTMDDCIQRTELQVHESLIEERGGFLNALNEPTVIRTSLPMELRYASGRVLADTYRKLSIDQVIMEHDVTPEQLSAWLNRQMNQARPNVSECGGGMRVMVGLPVHSSDSKIPNVIKEQFEVKPTAVAGTSGDFVICFEGEDVSLANVAFRLMEQRPDAEDLSKRIQTRNDIEWSSLGDLF